MAGSGWEQWNAGLAPYLLGETSRSAGRIIDLVRKLVPFEAALVLAYRTDQPPSVIYSDLEKDWRSDSMDAYLAGAYLLDPFYLLVRSGIREGLYRLRDIAPDTFKRTDYYRTYYGQANIGDEINFLHPLDRDVTLAVVLERAAARPMFGVGEIERLSAIRPVLAAMLSTSAEPAALRADGEQRKFHSHIEGALDRFGSSVLTERERQVLALLLRGHSKASIANRLKVAEGTVAVHKRNIYDKLDVKSQSELFPLFLLALQHLDPGRGADPLVALSVPRATG